jgi:hypothetical protein
MDFEYVIFYKSKDKPETFAGETNDLEEAFGIAQGYLDMGPDYSVLISNSEAKSIRWPGLRGHYTLQATFEDIIELQMAYMNNVRKILDDQLAGPHDLWHFTEYLNDYMNQYNGMMKDSWVKELHHNVMAQQGHRNMLAEMDLHQYEQYNGDVGWKSGVAMRNGIPIQDDDPYWDLVSDLDEDYSAPEEVD